MAEVSALLRSGHGSVQIRWWLPSQPGLLNRNHHTSSFLAFSTGSTRTVVASYTGGAERIPKLKVKMIQPLNGQIPGLPLNRWAFSLPLSSSLLRQSVSNHLEVYCLAVWFGRHPPPPALPALPLHWLGLLRTEGGPGHRRKTRSKPGPDSEDTRRATLQGGEGSIFRPFLP